ncbi:MAG TPA: site-specific DNA-methyltransferase, partial [Candidatus Pacearchaeota archaeon]|nr:site-specific DNA-methyltransferase [Candidatus Pacearchaeota archaeon]
KDWQFLPIDTKHFKDLEIEIVGLFDNLDEALDGRLIKSDNFQALNTLLPKYREQVQTIYIDPPFNLGENADFDYLVNYKDSTWATLLENRSTLSYELLTKSGGIFVRCDYNGNWIIRPILDSAFQKNYRNEIIVSKSAKLTEQINKYHSGHDSLYFFTKSNNYDFQTTTRKRLDPKWRGMHLPGIRWSPISNQYLNLFSKKNILEKKGNFYTRARIILGKELLPPEGRHWALNQDSVFNLEKENKIKWGDNGEPQTQESEEQRLTDNWTDWVGYSSIWGFTTENHEKIIERSIRTSSLKEKEIILDFFLGSGTTTAVAHKLMKKWIGVEVGEQFENKILHRMKEVLAGRGHHEPTGISKEINWQGGGFFKYYELEQYEDVLKRANYSPTEKELQKIDFNFSTLENGAKAERKKQIEDSFSLSEKLADKGLEVDLKKEKARFVFEKLYPDVDIAETISNLFGKKIKKIGKDKVIFEDDSEVDLNNLDFTRYASLKKLIYW